MMYDGVPDPWGEDEGTEEEDNWLVSYADLLTNLLAFFVLMFAISNVQNVRFEMLAQTFSNDREKLGVFELQERVDRYITERGLSEALETVLDASGLQIRFRAKMLFPQGEAALSEGGAALLQPIGALLDQLGEGYFMVVEGHTDDLPISTLRFASNWELSAQRAVHVVRQLISLGVSPERVSAQAFADTRPTAKAGSHSSLEEQRRNDRRVVVRVF